MHLKLERITMLNKILKENNCEFIHTAYNNQFTVDNSLTPTYTQRNCTLTLVKVKIRLPEVNSEGKPELIPGRVL